MILPASSMVRICPKAAWTNACSPGLMTGSLRPPAIPFRASSPAAPWCVWLLVVDLG
nr:MAG TPA: hypothetical protein [Caudoviricetes sp.]